MLFWRLVNSALAGMLLAMFIVWPGNPDWIRIIDLAAAACCIFAAWYDSK